ncbi:glycosyltransferase [Streptomyces sp. NPDC002769]|uniref:glycosyltransferase n=1 Tax=Streptomyces sp. NPDC002769 TaxID=3154542 RepID=UPI00331D3AD0
MSALGEPWILIRLATSAGNGQEHNAPSLQEVGAAVAVLRDVVTPEGVRDALAPLVSSPGERRHMTRQAE